VVVCVGAYGIDGAGAPARWTSAGFHGRRIGRRPSTSPIRHAAALFRRIVSKDCSLRNTRRACGHSYTDSDPKPTSFAATVGSHRLSSVPVPEAVRHTAAWAGALGRGACAVARSVTLVGVGSGATCCCARASTVIRRAEGLGTARSCGRGLPPRKNARRPGLDGLARQRQRVNDALPPAVRAPPTSSRSHPVCHRRMCSVRCPMLEIRGSGRPPDGRWKTRSPVVWRPGCWPRYAPTAFGHASSPL